MHRDQVLWVYIIQHVNVYFYHHMHISQFTMISCTKLSIRHSCINQWAAYAKPKTQINQPKVNKSIKTRCKKHNKNQLLLKFKSSFINNHSKCKIWAFNQQCHIIFLGLVNLAPSVPRSASVSLSQALVSHRTFIFCHSSAIHWMPSDSPLY